MNNNIFKGLITALITPFNNEQIDIASLERLITRQINSKIDAIVVGGSTGEGSSLNSDEYYTLIKSATEISNNRIPIIAGIASSGTREALEKIQMTEAIGVDAIMCTVPPYIRPEQNGIFEHFRVIQENTALPIMVYIHPARTGVDLTDETIFKLTGLPKITGIKDAGDDINRPLRLSIKHKSNINMLTGNDENAVAYSAHGGKGWVSVASNILPDLCGQMQSYLEKGDYAAALDLQKTLIPFYEAIFAERNPIGVKYAASLLGLCNQEVRLPLTEASIKTKNQIEIELKKSGL